MSHDSTAGCSSNGFVMSASRGTKGEVTWSTCSRNVAQSLDKDCLRDNDGGPSEWDHMDKYDNRPGTLYNAILRIARNFLETRENIKISTHPSYHVNLD